MIGDDMENRKSKLLRWGLPIEGALLVAGLLGCRLFAVPVGFSNTGVAVATGLGAAALLLLAFFAMLRSQARPLVRIREILDTSLMPLIAQATWLELAAISALAGIGEEWLFRAFLQTGLIKLTALWPGILIAAAIFGVAHYITHAYFIIAAILGALLGLLYVWTDNIVSVIIAHAVYDFMALLVMQRKYAGSELRQSPK
jgi:membrane protease YdiL (CAAX protease family)